MTPPTLAELRDEIIEQYAADSGEAGEDLAVWASSLDHLIEAARREERANLIAERDAYRDALRALVAALPVCEYPECEEPATRNEWGQMRCDADLMGHQKRPVADCVYAAPLRAALALLKGT